jgi:hypothetical protein
LAHTKCINKYWKYTQIFAATQSSKNSLQKQAKLIAKIKLGRTYCEIIGILALAKNISLYTKHWRLPKIFAHVQNICAYLKYLRISKTSAHI